jgi:hypothetical protein
VEGNSGNRQDIGVAIAGREKQTSRAWQGHGEGIARHAHRRPDLLDGSLKSVVSSLIKPGPSPPTAGRQYASVVDLRAVAIRRSPFIEQPPPAAITER